MRRSVAIVLLQLVVSSQELSAMTPGGLVSSHNYGFGFASPMEITITVEREPPASSSYFWAQQFYTNATIDHGGYFGIQTGGIIAGQRVGKMFIFSIWNATAAEAGPGAVAQTFGGEGVGYSIRKATPWKEGIPYSFRLQKDTELWWRLTVRRQGENPEELGRIRITQNVELTSGFASFTEYFGDLPSCDGLPFTRVLFSELLFGSVILPAGDCASYGTCAFKARGLFRGADAVHEVGVAPGRRRAVRRR